MSTLMNDARFALRMLAKNPGFTFIAALTLALGIGLNSAVFSVVNALLLRTLPAQSSEQLVNVYSTDPRFTGMMSHTPSSYPDYRDLAAGAQSFEDLAAYALSGMVLDRDGQGQLVFGEMVTGNYFPMLGLQAVIGRLLTPEDDRPGAAHPVTVLSYDLWQRDFGADPAVLGETVLLNGMAITIVGVAPETWRGMMLIASSQLYIPIGMSVALDAQGTTTLGNQTPETEIFDDRARQWIWMLGRRQADVSFTQVEAEVRTLAGRLAGDHPETNEDRSLVAFPTNDVTLLPSATPVVRGASMALMGIVGLVLLIACANIANMLLARAAARRKEIATRLALGASRAAVVRQLLIESLALAGFGGVLGLALAAISNRLLNSLDLPFIFDFNLALGLDWPVIVFTLVASTVTAVAFGLAPAFASTRGDLAVILHDESRGMAGGVAKRRLRSALVVSQVALALLLLICAGLSVRGMGNAYHIDPGFDPSGMVVARFVPPPIGYDDARIDSFYDRLKERIDGLSGIESAAYATSMPLTVVEFSVNSVAPSGTEKPAEEWPWADSMAVDDDYFTAMDIPMTRGRAFRLSDTQESPGVVVINETLAELYWPGQDPVGQQLLMGDAESSWEIVGVARNGKYRSLGEEPRPFVYTSMTQMSGVSWRTLLVRVGGPLQATLAAIRQESRQIDDKVTIVTLDTMENAISPSLILPRASAGIFGIFGMIGLVLAATGIYGVIAYTVSQRTHEIGVRMAMGAKKGDILRLMVRDGIVLTLAGVVLGIVGALVTTRLLASVLYGISSTDLVTFLLVPAFLATVALIASWLPARRAARVDPLSALRYE